MVLHKDVNVTQVVQYHYEQQRGNIVPTPFTAYVTSSTKKRTLPSWLLIKKTVRCDNVLAPYYKTRGLIPPAPKSTAPPATKGTALPSRAPNCKMIRILPIVLRAVLMGRAE